MERRCSNCSHNFYLDGYDERDKPIYAPCPRWESVDCNEQPALTCMRYERKVEEE